MPPYRTHQRSVQPAVPHYWGDAARMLMLLGAVLALLIVPFSRGFLHDAFPLDVAAGLAIIAFAALTSPLNSWIVAIDALLSGCVAALFELDAFGNYGAGEYTTFVLYEAAAVLFAVAFYFSLKTLRAFALHQVGKRDTLAEFGGGKAANAGDEPDPLAAEKSFEIPKVK